jgi:hypothetical protein
LEGTNSIEETDKDIVPIMKVGNIQMCVSVIGSGGSSGKSWTDPARSRGMRAAKRYIQEGDD